MFMAHSPEAKEPPTATDPSFEASFPEQAGHVPTKGPDVPAWSRYRDIAPLYSGIVLP
jgi:hypothetical protein